MFRFGFRVVGILTFCTPGGPAERSPRTICVGATCYSNDGVNEHYHHQDIEKITEFNVIVDTDLQINAY